jgi:hypothetical protein
MMVWIRLLLLVTTATMLSCAHPARRAACDRELAARVPAGTIVLAGVDLDRLRTSAAYSHLPKSAIAALSPFEEAQSGMVAWTGTGILMLARGAMPGSTAVARGVAISGSPDLTAEAMKPHAILPIVTVADAIARRPVWAVVRGRAPLPLPGNFANLNNFLAEADWITLTADLQDPSVIELTATCGTPEAATRLERSLRAAVTLGAATARQPDLKNFLSAIRIERKDKLVQADARTRFDVLSGLFE